MKGILFNYLLTVSVMGIHHAYPRAYPRVDEPKDFLAVYLYLMMLDRRRRDGIDGLEWA